MKLLRWGPHRAERPGVLDATMRLRDLSGVGDDIAGAMLLPERLSYLRDIDLFSLPVAPPHARIGPCVGQVGKIICIGLNYSDHAAETGATPPSEPIIFLKATSAICGPYDDLCLPRGATKVDWELELGVVIGTPGVYIAERDALGHVAGYCVANDVSERAYQLERLGTWDKGKGCDTFAPIGPWLVTADEVPDPQVLTMQLDVNGHAQQRGNTSRMIFGVAQVIAYVSQFMSLQSGDIILTGTPPGVAMGRKPPNYLRAGDRLTATIAGLGEQRQSVVESTTRKILPNANEHETF